MLKSITIENFRGFSKFRLNDLGRVNLLVGRNNSGKSSILEAIELLHAVGDPSALWRGLERRGEISVEDDDARRFPDLNIKHFFKGHEVRSFSEFSIAGDSEYGKKPRLSVNVREYSSDEAQEKLDFLPRPDEQEEIMDRLMLVLEWGNGSQERAIFPLSPDGVLNWNFLRKHARFNKLEEHKVRLITTASLDIDDVISLFDQVVLTPEEDLVIEALRIIAPNVEKIASVGSGTRSLRRSQSGGIVVKVSNLGGRIPIGSMGDGMWRMLGLALSLVRSDTGVLLVDEIDTGLHFSVMKSMWNLVIQTAKRLDVQVFATTHSRDCYESLASAVKELELEDGEVSIQRIEKEGQKAVSFSKDEILAAAARGIEIR